VIIIRRALTHPVHTILTNAGEEASGIVGMLLAQYGSADKFAWGYDAQKGEYVDMIKAGIVDPLKVVRTALVGGSGVASLLTTSEVCVVDAPEKDKPAGGSVRGWEVWEVWVDSKWDSSKASFFIWSYYSTPLHYIHTLSSPLLILITNTHHSVFSLQYYSAEMTKPTCQNGLSEFA
jgi:hypothetical protein